MIRKIVYVKIKNKKGKIVEYPFISPVKYNIGDKVICEGINNYQIVSNYVEYDELLFPYELNKLRRIIGKYEQEEIEIEVNISNYFSYPIYHLDKILKKLDGVSNYSFIPEISFINNSNNELLLDVDFVFDNDFIKIKSLNNLFVKRSSKLTIKNLILDVDYEKYILDNNLDSHLTINCKFGDKLLNSKDLYFKKLMINTPSIEFIDEPGLFYKYVKFKEKKDVNQLLDEIKELKLDITRYNFNNIKDDYLLDDVILVEDINNHRNVSNLDLALYLSKYVKNSFIILANDNIYLGINNSKMNVTKDNINELINNEIKVINLSNLEYVNELIDNDTKVFNTPDLNNEKYIDIIFNDKEAYSYIGDDVDYSIVPTISEEVISKGKEDKITMWERKLLDLNELNPLVSLKIKESNAIRVVSNKNVIDELKKKNNPSINLIEPETSVLDYLNGLDFDISINSDFLLIGNNKTLNQLIKKNKQMFNETGTHTLYLLLGVIKYKTDYDTLKAPFLMLPLNIKVKNKDLFELSYDFEELMLNEAFLEYYSNINPYVSFDELYECGNSYIELKNKILSYNLDVDIDFNQVLIMNLSFSHYSIWQDMRAHHNEILKNKITKAFIDETKYVENNFIDYDDNFMNLSIPSSYDESELEAIKKSISSKSFVLDGPPGTGKSQTIVNILANALYQDKTVLFIAKKAVALDVVYKRLKNLGYEDYVLDLYSERKLKDVFISKLKKALEEKENNDIDYEELLLDIRAKRLEIENIFDKLNKDKYYYSLYTSILKYRSIDSDFVDLNDNFLINLTKDIDDTIRIILNDIIAISKNINNYNDSLLKAIGITNINFYEKDNLKKDFNDLDFSFTRLYKLSIDLLELLGDLIKPTLKNIKNIVNVLDIIYNKEIFNNKIYSFLDYYDEKNILDLISRKEKLDDFKNKHSYFYYSKIIDIDATSRIDELNSDLGFFKKLSLNKELKLELQNITKLTKINNYSKYYEEIEEYNEMYNYLKENEQAFVDLCGISLLDNDTKKIIDKYNNTKEFIEIFRKLTDDNNSIKILKILLNLFDTKDETINNYLIRLKEAINKFDISYEKINNKYLINYEIFEKSSDEFKLFKSFIDEVMNSNINDVINISNINNKLKSLAELDLNELIFKINNKIDIEDLINIYDKSLADGYLKLYFLDDDINYFNSNMFNKTINNYKELINKYFEYTKIEAINDINKKISEFDFNKEKYQLSKLKKMLQTSKLSIRNVIENYSKFIRLAFPIVMTTPDKLSKYLPYDKKKYDLVIFDEASQIPTHEAIMAIIRGNSLIVSGDPMQMPPSNYFKGDIKSDDDIVDDADSLLDECLAIGLDNIRLKYHYRSHSESLIDFSNKNFYDNELYTFPDSDGSFNIKLVKTEHNKVSSRISDNEMDKVFEIIEDIYSNDETKNKSLGIIVFNVLDVEIAENKLNKYLSNHKNIKKCVDDVYENKGEDLFVKSLENVQGDERDIIILVVSFGLNSLNHPFINGPIVRIGGERRLNVAITRSRSYMYLVSTISSSDFINKEKINSNGVRLLRDFIEYVEVGNNLIKEKETKNDLCLLIQKDLAKHGYESDINVGRGNIKIDLAIKKNNKYILGIFIDKSDNLNILDSLYVKDNQLTNLGWKLVHIYSLEYYKDNKATIRHILNYIENNKLDSKPEYNILEYTDSIISTITYDKVFGFNNLNDYIDIILKTEGPISLNKIEEVIMKNADIKVLSTSQENSIYEILAKKNFTFDQNNLKFYWKDKSNYIDYYRTSDRNIYDISKEELGYLVLEILKYNEFVSMDELYSLIKPFINNVEIDDMVKSRVDYVYKYLIDNDLL